LLFRRVDACPDPTTGDIPYGFLTCEDYWADFADDMQQRSFQVGAMWGGLLLDCLIGFTLMFVGFGRASERLSKRVRNDAFTSLVRQEISFFDKRSVGKITSELQDDAARIHAFSGVPIRSSLLALSSVVTGLVLSFVVRCRLINHALSLCMRLTALFYRSTCGLSLFWLWHAYHSWPSGPQWK
jgi:ATP-binding cassette, subfamily B (MDR/TAP), member 1